MRLIDADALINDCKKCLNKINPSKGARLHWLIGILSNAPTVEPEQRWIPVTERLPDKECFVLVTVNDGAIYTDLSLFRHDGRFIEHTGDVIAWMPLPEPYLDGEE